MNTTEKTSILACAVAFHMANISYDKATKLYTFTENLDWYEPVSRALPKAEVNMYYLFNTQEVRWSATVLQYIAEQNIALDYNVWSTGTRLTTTRKIRGINNYFDFRDGLTPEQLKFCIEQSDKYVTDWNGNVNFTKFLLNDGTFEVGDIVRSTSDVVGCQIGIVVCTSINSPVLVLLKSGMITLENLYEKDRNEVIKATELPEAMVTGLQDAYKQYAEATQKEKADVIGRRVKAAEKQQEREAKFDASYEGDMDKMFVYFTGLRAKFTKPEDRNEFDKVWVPLVELYATTQNREEKEQVLGAFKEVFKLFSKTERDAQKKAEKAKAAKDAKDAKAKAGEAGKTEQPKTEATNPVFSKRAKKETLTGEQIKELGTLYKKTATLIHPDKFAKATPERQKWANENFVLLQALKEKNRLKEMRDLSTQIREALKTEKAAPKAEQAEATA